MEWFDNFSQNFVIRNCFLSNTWLGIDQVNFALTIKL